MKNDIPSAPVRIHLDRDTKDVLSRIGQTILSVLVAYLTDRLLHWVGSGNPGTVTAPTTKPETAEP